MRQMHGQVLPSSVVSGNCCSAQRESCMFSCTFAPLLGVSLAFLADTDNLLVMYVLCTNDNLCMDAQASVQEVAARMAENLSSGEARHWT